MNEADVLNRHGFHALRVKEVVDETVDTRSFVLDVPDDLSELFRYQPGQFCTFRVRIGEDELTRCYSMSSAPETDADLTVTVKRVPGGAVSNWLNDHVDAGDVLEVTRPAGTFCARPNQRPVIGLCGGSGVTPVLSIAKSVLTSSSRPVGLLYANRDADSIIFDSSLTQLRDQHPDRLEVRHHLDSNGGYLDAAAIVAFVGDRLDADFYICGPGPFMDLVEGTLLDLGVDSAAIFIERFVTAGSSDAAGPDATGAAAAGPDATGAAAAGPDATGAGEAEPGTTGSPDTITVILRGKKHELPYRAGDTVLETARRANVPTPYSCEAGSCATCMALVREGTVKMRVNDALDPDEVDEGWVLTCQSLPTDRSLTVEFEPL